MSVITTSKCPECKYCVLNQEDKKNVIVHCNARNKDYHYGQRIPCEDMEKKERK